MNYQPYSADRRRAIVDDLLKKRPSGGADREGMEFREKEDYCDRYRQWRRMLTCNKTYWGYSVEQIYRLNLHSETAVETYVAEHYFDGVGRWHLPKRLKPSFSRKVNRIWDRIQEIRQAIRAGRLPGIYRISTERERAVLGFVLARDGVHAAQLGATLFAAWAGGSKTTAKWIGWYDAAQLTSHAATLQKNLEEKIQELDESYRQRRAEAVARLEQAGMATLIALDLASEDGAA